MHKKIFSCLAAIFAVFMLSHTSSAQQLHPKYIYCKVDFQFSRQVKGWKVNMFVDYGQADLNISRGEAKVIDADGEGRIFNSEIAGLNWLSLQGWELVPYPTLSDGDSSSKYYVRMNVTGLSYEEINERLSVFSNKKYNMSHADTVKIQQDGGLYK